jgi:hypothetical protein
MSKIALSPNASGTGVFTIASPSGNTDRTLTLPDEAGTVLTTSSAISRANLPAGSVLQVQSFTSTTPATHSGGWADMGDMSISITPYYSTSKILIIASLHTEMNSSNVGSTRINRNGTVIGSGAGGAHRTWLSQGYSGINGTNSGVQYLDSPATTSALTYKLQWWVDAGTAYLNRGVGNTSFNDTSTITVWEIAG